MSQFLRPDGTITATRIAAGDHTAIDEVIPSDGDYVRTLGLSYGGPSAIYECSLSDPFRRPGPGLSAFRWRGRESIDGSECRFSIRQGADEIWARDGKLPSATPFTYIHADVDLSAVTDWTDLRARFEFYALPGEGSNIQAYLYWMELEVPDPIGSGAIIMF